jgi:hypothetical protein
MSSWIFTKVKNGAKPMASGPAYAYVANVDVLRDVLIRTESCLSKQARYQLSHRSVSSSSAMLNCMIQWFVRNKLNCII